MKNLLLLPVLFCGLVFSSVTFAQKSNNSKAPAKTSSKKVEKKVPKKREKPVNVVIETSMGTIEAELNPEKAPITVKNFLNYTERKFYDDLVFHRVIKDFMIQGGGFDKDLKLRPTDAPIQNEANNGLKNDKGTLAMARTPDPHSASSQFFINLKDNDFLNFKIPNAQGYGYCVFGKVNKGMDVVEKIGAVATGSASQMRDVPTTPVIIKSIRKAEEKK